MPDGMALNLSGADLSGFKALDSGPYDCTVYDTDWIEIKEDSDGKLPPGTPGLKVQFKVDNEAEFGTRYFWTNYWIAPADYDKDKKAKLDGMLARFLMAVGYSEDEITNGKFKLDKDDLIGRECVVVVGQKPSYNDPEQMENVVKNVRPRSANLSEAGVI